MRVTKLWSSRFVCFQASLLINEVQKLRVSLAAAGLSADCCELAIDALTARPAPTIEIDGGHTKIAHWDNGFWVAIHFNPDHWRRVTICVRDRNGASESWMAAWGNGRIEDSMWARIDNPPNGATAHAEALRFLNERLSIA